MVYSSNIKGAILEAVQAAHQPFFTKDLIPAIEALIERPIHPKRVAYYLRELEDQGYLTSNKYRNGGTKQYRSKVKNV